LVYSDKHNINISKIIEMLLKKLSKIYFIISWKLFVVSKKFYSWHSEKVLIPFTEKSSFLENFPPIVLPILCLFS
jgi:hypothetical protein